MSSEVDVLGAASRDGTPDVGAPAPISRASSHTEPRYGNMGSVMCVGVCGASSR